MRGHIAGVAQAGHETCRIHDRRPHCRIAQIVCAATSDAGRRIVEHDPPHHVGESMTSPLVAIRISSACLLLYSVAPPGFRINGSPAWNMFVRWYVRGSA